MAKQSLLNKQSESQIQSSICDYLELKRYFFFRLNNIPAFQKNEGGGITMRRLPKHTPRGLPDIIVVELEVKSAIGKLSPEQVIIQNRVITSKGKYFVVRSIDDVIKAGL
jgi:hypothetical protein